MSNFTSNFIGRINSLPYDDHNQKVDLSKIPLGTSNSPNQDAVLNEMAHKFRDDLVKSGKIIKIDYMKADGSMTEMTITLNPDHYPKETPNNSNSPIKKPGQLSVWSIDRDGWRTINVDKIVHVKTDIRPETPKPDTFSVELSHTQQKLLYFWITGAVHPALTNTGKNMSIELTTTKDGITIREKNSGLSLDL